MLYKLPPDGPHARANKLQENWKYGCVLGHHRVSPEHHILDEEDKCMRTARSIQRLEPNQGWRADVLEQLRDTPQGLHKQHEPRVRLEGAPDTLEAPDTRTH